MNLLETLLGIAVGLVFLSMAAGLFVHTKEQRLEQKIAEEIRTMAIASLAYAEGHTESLFAETKEREGPSFSTKNGIPEALAPYLNYAHTGKNSLGQHYLLTFRKVALTDAHSSLLGILVTEGTTHLSEKNIRSIAANLAGHSDVASEDLVYEMGGYVGGDGFLHAPNAHFDLSRFAITASTGSIGMVFTILNIEAWARAHGSDVLFRKAITSFPRFNEMETDLAMGGNSIASLSALDFQVKDEGLCDEAHAGRLMVQKKRGKEGFSAMLCTQKGSAYQWQEVVDTSSPSIQDVAIVASGTPIPKPVCQNGEPVLFLMPLAKENQSSFLVQVAHEDTLSWTPRLAEEGRELSSQEGLIQAMSLCRPN